MLETDDNTHTQKLTEMPETFKSPLGWTLEVC